MRLTAKNPKEKIIIIPIPISPARRRERGYNQCELLAKAIHSAASRKNNGEIFEIRTDILFRSVHTERQTLKRRGERLQNTRGIFSVHKKYMSTKPSQISENKSLQHQAVVIIDDVLTTGSTLREAILTLEKAGFTNVSALTLAH
jgi:predicted amidophosphoribosyltransferase